MGFAVGVGVVEAGRVEITGCAEQTPLVEEAAVLVWREQSALVAEAQTQALVFLAGEHFQAIGADVARFAFMLMNRREAGFGRVAEGFRPCAARERNNDE